MENLIGVFQASFPTPLFALYASTGAKSHYWGQYTACGRWLKEQSLCKTQLPTTGDLQLSEMKCLVHLFLHLSPSCGQSPIAAAFLALLCFPPLFISPSNNHLWMAGLYYLHLTKPFGLNVLIAGQDKYAVVQIITGSFNKNKPQFYTNILFSTYG